jgi:hypothetical protein
MQKGQEIVLDLDVAAVHELRVITHRRAASVQRPRGRRISRRLRLMQNVSWRISNLLIVGSITHDGRYNAISTALANLSIEMPLEHALNIAQTVLTQMSLRVSSVTKLPAQPAV